MPSFLNKVFGYKRHEGKEAARSTRDTSDNALLDGKYEAIPPILSPSAATFLEAQQTKDLGRDGAFSFFKPRSHGVPQNSAQKPPEPAPYLTLQLPRLTENSDSRALGNAFEADLDSQTVLGDAIVTAKRLNPLEALILVRACSQTIIERGLETLGIMHPHWFSASPDVQRKLISLFIHSLDPQRRITTLSPTPTSPTSAFEVELHYTRLPHDVAAVLRWGLRHLSLENGRFGEDDTEWAWYSAFFHAERNASYPPNGFSSLLLPHLPASHVELLTTTLSLVSSLASHAESNSISGSRLSKFLGIWLLVATRAERSDDWSRFYARWERAGRILEHLFLARLREESLTQRLPTRLQELVKYYPYSRGSPATEDELLSRPRFSTRQYDALLVRIETLLTHGAEQPKQHPIQLLLEAFQLPIDNPSGDDHIALWNTLKTTASKEATSSDLQGPQFTRIFVDETIQLLALIPADNNVPTSPTLFTSPATKAVSLERSPSLSKFLEGSTPRSNANNGSVPVSPTSPSSSVTTDWVQFSLTGFGNTPPTRPLAALLDQDEDTEVTQPQISRKPSRQHGKSRTRRRRSEDREPHETPPSSQSKPEPSIVDTKLTSVRVVQIDEAFIDFWSDAIVDPISADWPTFVICGLKQVTGVELLIHWLVVEQTYSYQQPLSPRVPSPDGHRGRSPRPSTKSDISGFRINSMFSSARKRFSAFNRSATDLSSKKSGGKTPIAGELGEALFEEEQALPSAPPAKVDHHVDENAAVRTITGVTANVTDQPKMDGVITASLAGIPTTDPVLLRKDADRAPVATEASSVEPTLQPGISYSSSPVLPRSSLKTSEEEVPVEQGSLLTPDIINPEVNAADPAAKITPLPADTSNPQSTLDNSNSMVLVEPALAIENLIVEEPRVRQDVAIDKAEDRLGRPLAQSVNADKHLAMESTGQPSNVVQVNVLDGFREDAEVVTMPLAPETVAVLLTAPTVDDRAPEHIAQEPEPYMGEQSLRKAPVDPLAASTVESDGPHVMDDCLPLSGLNGHDKITAIETGAHLEPGSIVPVVDGGEEDADIAEHVDIPTPAPEAFVALVEETPSPGASVGACTRVGAAQHPAAEPQALEDAALQPVVAEFQATLNAEQGSAAQPVKESSVAAVSAIDTSAQVAAGEAEHAAGEASEVATEEVQPPAQNGIVQASVEAPLVGAILVPEVNFYVSAAQDVAPAEAEAHPAPEGFVSGVRIDTTQDTGASTPVLEHVIFVDDTPGLEIAARMYTPVQTSVAPWPELEAMEDKAAESLVQANAQPINSIPLEPSVETEPPTQFTDTQPADIPLTHSTQEDLIAVLGAADETIVLEPEAHPTPTAFFTSENAPIKDTSGPAHLTPSATADPEPVVGEAAKPTIEEVQVLVEEGAISTSGVIAVIPTVASEEPAAQDVQVPIGIKESSNESAPHSVDETTNPLPVSISVPEEVSSVKVVATQGVAETVLVDEIHSAADADASRTRADQSGLAEVDAPTPVAEETETPVKAEESSQVEVTEKVMASQLQAVRALENSDETHGVNGSQEVADLVEQFMKSQTDASIPEPAGLSKETTPAES